MRFCTWCFCQVKQRNALFLNFSTHLTTKTFRPSFRSFRTPLTTYNRIQIVTTYSQTPVSTTQFGQKIPKQEFATFVFSSNIYSCLLSQSNAMVTKIRSIIIIVRHSCTLFLYWMPQNCHYFKPYHHRNLAQNFLIFNKCVFLVFVPYACFCLAHCGAPHHIRLTADSVCPRRRRLRDEPLIIEMTMTRRFPPQKLFPVARQLVWGYANEAVAASGYRS